jgi:acyl carrier protein
MSDRPQKAASPADGAEGLRSPDELGRWLVCRVAFYVRRPAAEIELDTPLADYGLDSLYAFALLGEIEDTLELEIDPAVLWDSPTAAGLAAHLVERMAGNDQSGPKSQSPGASSEPV